MNLKFEATVQIFRKIIQINSVNILKSANEYYRLGPVNLNTVNSKLTLNFSEDLFAKLLPFHV